MNLVRQSIGVHVHLASKFGTVAPTVSLATDGSGIANVGICNGLTVQSDEAETLRTIAQAFLAAAASIDALTTGAIPTPSHKVDWSPAAGWMYAWDTTGDSKVV